MALIKLRKFYIIIKYLKFSKIHSKKSLLSHIAPKNCRFLRIYAILTETSRYVPHNRMSYALHICVVPYEKVNLYPKLND